MVLPQRFGLFLYLASSFLIRDVVADCTAAGGECCNICRNGGVIQNPNHEFDMIDTFRPEFSHRWSCGWLQTNMAAVNVGSTGAKGEARYCGVAQRWADLECICSGPPAPPEPVYDPNGACDLCAIPEAMLPQPDIEYENEMVDTKVAGSMPCGGLYYALQEGVLSPNLCPIVQEAAGPKCCSLPSIGAFDSTIGGGNGGQGGDSGGDSGGGSGGDSGETCLEPGDLCEGNGNAGCCLGFICRERQIGDAKTCSLPSNGGGAGRDRYGGNGRGGAGGGGRNLRKRE